MLQLKRNTENFKWKNQKLGENKTEFGKKIKEVRAMLGQFLKKNELKLYCFNFIKNDC